jgi:hypothetical protein
MRAALAPLHLLVFDHSFADHLIHRPTSLSGDPSGMKKGRID